MNPHCLKEHTLHPGPTAFELSKDAISLDHDLALLSNLEIKIKIKIKIKSKSRSLKFFLNSTAAHPDPPRELELLSTRRPWRGKSMLAATMFDETLR